MKRSHSNLLKFLALLLVFCLIPATTAQAKKAKKPKAPKIAKTVYIDGDTMASLKDDYDDEGVIYSLRILHTYRITELPIKNLAKDAVLLNPAAEQNGNYIYHFETSRRKGKLVISGCYGLSNWEGQAMLGVKVPVTIRLRQNGQDYELKTNFQLKYSSDFKKVVFSGKKAKLGNIKKAQLPTFALPKNGILKKISVSMAKGCKYKGVVNVKRIIPRSSDGWQEIPYTKGMTLQKGDIISLKYRKKGMSYDLAQDFLVQ